MHFYALNDLIGCGDWCVLICFVGCLWWSELRVLLLLLCFDWSELVGGFGL